MEQPEQELTLAPRPGAGLELRLALTLGPRPILAVPLAAVLLRDEMFH